MMFFTKKEQLKAAQDDLQEVLRYMIAKHGYKDEFEVLDKVEAHEVAIWEQKRKERNDR